MNPEIAWIRTVSLMKASPRSRLMYAQGCFLQQTCSEQHMIGKTKKMRKISTIFHALCGDDQNLDILDDVPDQKPDTATKPEKPAAPGPVQN